MWYTMAYLSAHYGALLDIGWDFGPVQQLFFSLMCVFICQLTLSSLALATAGVFQSPELHQL